MDVNPRTVRLAIPATMIAILIAAVVMTMASVASGAPRTADVDRADKALMERSGSSCMQRAQRAIAVDQKAIDEAEPGWIEDGAIWKGDYAGLLKALGGEEIGREGGAAWILVAKDGGEVAERWVEVRAEAWYQVARITSQDESVCEAGDRQGLTE